MDTPVQRRTFNARLFSCLRAENFSNDAIDVQLINVRVQTIRKLERHLESIEEVTRRMHFQENTRLLTVLNIIFFCYLRLY